VQPSARVREVFAAHRKDLVVTAAIFVVTFLLILASASRIDATAFTRRNFDIYLQGDLPRTYVEMVTRFSNGGRTAVHPLYPLAVHPITALIHSVFPVTWLEAVRSVVALIASVWATLLFACGRLLGIRIIDAVLVTAVGLVGAAARFWLVVPETFAIGGVALLIAVAVAARTDVHELGDASYVAAGVATFGSTLTNWSTGILLALTSGSLSRAVRISLQAVGATALLWIFEKFLFPNVVFIFDPIGLRQYVHSLETSRIVDVTRVFLSHTAVAPAVEACRNVKIPETPFLLTFQGSRVLSGGSLGVGATLLWIGLLALGAYGLLRTRANSRARFVLGASLVFQYALHLVYGGETFLYSIHWWGLLVLTVALGFRTRLQWAVRLLAIAFIFVAGVHNWGSWESTLPVFRNGASGFPLNDRTCDF